MTKFPDGKKTKNSGKTWSYDDTKGRARATLLQSLREDSGMRIQIDWVDRGPIYQSHSKQ